MPKTINILTKNPECITVNVEVILFKEDDFWMSYCPALDISSYGKTQSGAKKWFGEVLEIFLEESTKNGTLEKHLLKQGWRLKQVPMPEYKQPPRKFRSVRSTDKSPSTTYQQPIMLPISC